MEKHALTPSFFIVCVLSAVAIVLAMFGPSPAAAQRTQDLPTTRPVRLLGLAFTPDSVTAGEPARLTIALTGTAPAGGMTINLSAGDSKGLSLPKSITIPKGMARLGLTVTTKMVKTTTRVTLFGSTGNDDPKAAATPPRKASLTIQIK